MNRTRKVLCLLLGLAIAAFALPGVAGNDQRMYSLNMNIVASPPAPTPPPFTVTATILNEGNSTISSFALFVTGLTIVGVDQPATGNATFTGSSVSVTNMHPLKSRQSLTVTVRVSSCGDGTWSAAVRTGSSLNGQTFNLVPGDSNLATSISCGDLASGDAFAVPDSLNPGCVTGERGYYDKDGSHPEGTIPYFVTNTIPTNGKLHFRWPDFQGEVRDPLATFEYEVCASGPLPEPGTTLVAWLNTDGTPASTPGTPAFITGLPCLANEDFLPEPFGELSGEGDVGVGDDTITVDTSLPGGAHPSIAHPSTPFDIVIDVERMTVNSVETFEESSVEVWSVTRGVGNTVPAAHSLGQKAMSTPLPLLPDDESVGFPYTPGSPALMCISDQDPGGEADEEEDEVVTGHSTTFIDIGGDGHVTGP